MSELPNKKQIEQKYFTYTPAFLEILSKIEEKLKDTIQLASNPTYKTRIKSFNSYYKKVLRLKKEEALSSKELITLTDLIGIRVICPFMEDLANVESQINANFDVKEIERKGSNQNFKEFGYESVHILIAIPQDCFPTESTIELPKDLVCEIQIRTILQDAWAEVEHELIYKSEFNPFDVPLRRKLASINASLSLADMIFQEIRDYQNKLQTELGYRRNAFYDKADELTELDDVKSTKLEAPVYNPCENAGTIDDLVLSALHYHNVGEFSKAIDLYTKILNSKPEPNNVVKGVIHKHRGMAYFAKNMYAEALQDFDDSVKNDPKAFRSLYYKGIVYSILDDNKKAIEAFSQSLEINTFQSHVYYRRALSYYNLSDYKKSLEDLNNAINMGLEDDDVQTLKSKLMKKFDMSM